MLEDITKKQKKITKNENKELDGFLASIGLYRDSAVASIIDLYDKFGTSDKGLSQVEVQKRLKQYGFNVPPPVKKTGIMGRFSYYLKNWFNFMLLLSSILSFFVGIISQDSTSFDAGFGLIVVLIINVIFSMIQEYRSDKIVQTINQIIPQKAKVIREDQLIQINVSDIVPGDIVLLKEGDKVPADIRLTNAFEVTVNNASLTGESKTQHRFATSAKNEDLLNPTELQNIIFAGTTIVTGEAKGIVLLTGKATKIGNIISLTRQIKEPISSLQKEIDHTASLTLRVAIIVGVVFLGIALIFIGLTITDSILFAIGVMMCLVPQGLQLTVSLSLALKALSMAKNNVAVKRLSSVETLGTMNVLCTDKTGTMTSGEMMIEKVWTDDKVFEVTGDGYNPVGLIYGPGRSKLKDKVPLIKLFEVATFCSNAKLFPPKHKNDRWTILGDPTDAAFLVFAKKGNFNVEKALIENPLIHLLPFESKRRMMTSIRRTPNGRLIAYTKGACDELLNRCTKININNQIYDLNSEGRQTILGQMNNFASQGYRVLAMANKILDSKLRLESDENFMHIESEMTFLGIVAHADPPRPRVKEAVTEAQRAGIKVIMLTGDYELTAEAIARRTGIISTQKPTIITGSEIEKMNQSELEQTLDKKEVVFARILPEQKLRIVRTLKSKGNIVGVTGDGVNDAPALLDANVGVAMGVGGTDVARESSDMVLLDNNFVSIVEAIKFGRSSFDNLRKFVGYLFTHNFAELGAFVTFVLLGIPLPLAVIQILAIDLGMDVVLSLSIIMEPPQASIMNVPPKKSNPLLDLRILLRAAYIGSIVTVVVLLFAFKIWESGGWIFGQRIVENPIVYAKGTTAVMIGIMAAQIGNLFTLRAGNESAIRLSPLKNKWIFIGIISQIGIMIAIVYIPFFQPFFGTAALNLNELLFLYMLTPAIFFIEEMRKFILRKNS